MDWHHWDLIVALAVLAAVASYGGVKLSRKLERIAKALEHGNAEQTEDDLYR